MDAPAIPNVPPEASAQPVAIDFAATEAPVHTISASSTYDTSEVQDAKLIFGKDQALPLAEDFMVGRRSASVDEDEGGGRSRGSTVSSQARPITPPATFTRASASAKTSIAPSAEHATPIVVVDLPRGNASTSSIR